MRKKIVAGNWKMNTIIGEGKELVNEIIKKMQPVSSDVHLIIAPPFTHLCSIGKMIDGTRLKLGAQNCADQAKGAYTGEVSAEMLKSVHCSYIILGHSERREYYGENAEKLIKKINLALDNGLTPIFCVGEKLQERDAGKHFEVISNQIKDVLFTLNDKQMSNIVIAYEPVWAIGTGKTATSDQAQEIHSFIRETISERFGKLSEEISILYGGSCKPSNAKELFAQRDIDGGLIGGAALKGDDFIGIAMSF